MCGYGKGQSRADVPSLVRKGKTGKPEHSPTHSQVTDWGKGGIRASEPSLNRRVRTKKERIEG